ncbi:hypothetical protein FPZ43_11545 [Mucilaginibacter pallidiroseus]|uniref:Uncharacterized protein n=1 Tax=Mucilaginibacter pallidiroseus TaxID=2599295 RepID=A0A563UC44_9SPHI|nr:chromate transporter [Mucilaginibacter pallidiroseus]TWR28896.1 hypothetical protein FPZ43_11545 [Mucilaginibacter pallidiroseus]
MHSDHSKNLFIKTAHALFFKASRSGLRRAGGLLGYMNRDLVEKKQWLTEEEYKDDQFVDAVAVAMITSVPMVITTGFVGYLSTVSWCKCSGSSDFPSLFLVQGIACAIIQEDDKNVSIKAFVKDITEEAMGALVGSVIIIATRSIIDFPTALILIGSAMALIYLKKVQDLT